MMSRKTNIVVLLLVAAEVLVCLVPTTLLYLAGQGWVLIFLLSGRPVSTIPLGLFEFSGIMLALGYALFSGWWLVFRFRSIAIREIPKYIWFGITLGVLASIVSLIADVDTGGIPKTSMAAMDTLKAANVLGGGPLVLLATLLATMHFRGRFDS